MLEGIAEVIAGLFCALIYGSEEKPRHPIWRYLLLGYTFSGFVLIVLGFLGFVSEDDIPNALIGIWFFVCVIALNGEYTLRSEKNAMIILVIGVILFVWGLLLGFEVI
jgi:uncharacterized membrane protein HdeD (DUF308 family)